MKSNINLMKVSTEFLYKKFDELNKIYFDGSLPHIKIKVCRDKSYFGTFSFLYRKVNNSKVPHDCRYIAISDYYVQTSREYANTLLHEMLHYYITYSRLSNRPDLHDKVFKSYMEKFNAMDAGYRIDIEGCSKGLDINEKYNKKEYTVVRFTYNEIPRIARVKHTMTYGEFNMKWAKNRNMKDITIETSTDPKCDRIPLSIRTLHMVNLEKFNAA